MTDLGRVVTVLDGFKGAPGYCTFHYFKTGVLGWDFWGQKAIDQVRDAWASIATLLPTGMTWTTKGDVDVVTDTTGQISQSWSLTPRTGVGTNVTGYGPIATGISVAYRTAGVVNGKHVRGRTFIVPVAADNLQTDGSLRPETIATMGSWYPALAKASETNLRFAVFSRPVKDKVTKVITRNGSSYAATAATIKDEYAVLRSRRN